MSSPRVAKSLGESFTFTLKNDSAATKIVAVLAAFFNTLALTEGAPNTLAYTNPAEVVSAGYPCDAVLDDGTILTDVVASSSNPKKTIRSFRRYIERVGATCVDMDIQGNNVDVFNKVLEVVTVNPMGGDHVEYMKLNKFLSVDQSSTSKIVAAGIELNMEAETLMLLPIDAGREVTLTFNF